MVTCSQFYGPLSKQSFFWVNFEHPFGLGTIQKLLGAEGCVGYQSDLCGKVINIEYGFLECQKWIARKFKLEWFLISKQ